MWTFIDDGRSRNGSFVNGERLHGSRVLHHGDVIAVGRTPIEFCAPLPDGVREHRRRRARPALPTLSPAQRRVLVALCRPFAESRFAAPPSNRELAGTLHGQRGDRQVPPARAVLALRARRAAAAPQARNPRTAGAGAGRGDPRGPAGRTRGGATTPFAQWRIAGARRNDRRTPRPAGGPSCRTSAASPSRAAGTRASAAACCSGPAVRSPPALSCSAARRPPAPRRPSTSTSRSASASPRATRRPAASSSGPACSPRARALDGSAMTQEPYGVRYEVAADEDFTQIVRRGTEEALWEESHTVHAEIAGLPSDRWYWYRFKWGTAISDVGRTRTAPRARRASRRASASRSRPARTSAGGYYGASRALADGGRRPRRPPRRLHLRGRRAERRTSRRGWMR